MPDQLDNDFVTRANELLKEKNYTSEAPYRQIRPEKIQVPNEISWKDVAMERLEMLNQMRDAMHAWQDVYQSEKARGDRLEARLLLSLDLASAPEDGKSEEIKHTVASPAQVNKKRANWPTVRDTLEKRFAELAKENEKEVDLERHFKDKEEVIIKGDYRDNFPSND